MRILPPTSGVALWKNRGVDMLPVAVKVSIDWATALGHANA
jgi:hypothetical protein